MDSRMKNTISIYTFWCYHTSPPGFCNSVIMEVSAVFDDCIISMDSVVISGNIAFSASFSLKHQNIFAIKKVTAI